MLFPQRCFTNASICGLSNENRFRASSVSDIPKSDLTIRAQWNILSTKIGAVAQLGERVYRTHEVVGSNPIGSTGIFRNVSSRTFLSARNT